MDSSDSERDSAVIGLYSHCRNLRIKTQNANQLAIGEYDMEKKTIGGFIAALRKANGMTQKELAERLHVSDKTVSRWGRDNPADHRLHEGGSLDSAAVIRCSPSCFRCCVLP